MGLFFWKNFKHVDAFAQSVADDLYSYVGPEIASQHVFGTAKLPPKQRRKVEQRFSETLVQIKRFSQSNSLGVYGKARLQRAFNNRLNELGYPNEVVMKLSENILLRNV